MMCSGIIACQCHSIIPTKRQPSNSRAKEGATAQLDYLYMNYAVSLAG